MKKEELVHGLTETVELKDWDFAIIQASLKMYIKHHKAKGNNLTVAYTQQLQKKLRIAFVRLIKRTKKEHRFLKSQLTHEKEITQYTS